jgi:type VI secretion system protein ImpK
MSQSDDPPDSRGRTVIRPRPGGLPSSPGAGAGGLPNRPDTGGHHQPMGAASAWGAPGSGWSGGNRSEGQASDWVSPVFPGTERLETPPSVARVQIPLGTALSARSSPAIKASNPIVQAAAPLLILLGRLRQMIIEMDAVPLMQHVSHSISGFEKSVLAAGVSEDQATIAKYALCATADDIVQNLPGTEKHVWLQYSMLAQFFGVRTSGTGFFDKIRQLNANPSLYFDLLELIHACLSLGFEGQYRSAMGGDIELQRVRRDVYNTLKTVRGGAPADLSPRWRGLQTKRQTLGEGIPLWSIGGVLAGLLAGLYLLLRFFIAADGDAVADTLVHLHPRDPVVLARTAFSPLPEPAPRPQTVSQLQRIRVVLGPEIQQGLVVVEPAGESIIIRLNNLLLFDSGSADVRPEFNALAQRVAKALDREPGNIRVVGHTDTVKPKPSGRFKSNFDLSVKRAEAVASTLAGYIAESKRLVVSGKGEDEPVASNASPEGRAQNRRVELAIPREETLGGGSAAEAVP